MRGDSLRDLYAKTVAILGLAILAAIGALVDYWPTATDVPEVASTIVRPSADSLPVIDVAVLSTVAVITPAVWRQRSSVSPVAVPVARTARPPGVAPVVVATETLMLAATRSIALSPPPAPTLVVPIAAIDLPGPEVTLPPPPPVQPEAAPVSLGAGQRPVAEGSGFFGNATSAVKKTGESIVNTTVKTGTSIIKAFGLVGSAVKKVI